MRAIILAAGRGSRLGAEDVPKPMYPIEEGGAVSILERQVRCLQKAGVGDITVVIGYRKEVVQERLGHLGVTFVVNSHEPMSASGSTHSLQFAACADHGPLDGTAQTLVLDGDIVYEQRFLATALEKSEHSRAIITPRTSADSEEVRVYAKAGVPHLLGKNLLPPVTDGLELLGESAGAWSFAAQDQALVRGLLTWLVGLPVEGTPFSYAKLRSEIEELAQYMMTLGRLSSALLPADVLFMEVDFPADLKRLREDLFARICAHDAA